MGNGENQRVAVIIEDEVDIRHLLEAVLTQAGFQVVATGNGLDGIDAVQRWDPLVTTLDVNMPGMDGFEVARRIRAFSDTYIVMLTALHEEIDVLQGLEAGADDYVNKPFRPRELRARIEAMLRRPRATPAVAEIETGPVSASSFDSATTLSVASPEQSPAVVPALSTVQTQHAIKEAPARPEAPATVSEEDPAGSGWLEHNGLWLNVESRVVRQDGSELDLTRSEFDLLATLMQSVRRVRTKPDLVLLLRGESYITNHFISDADKRAVEVHMGNLRKKLADNVAAPRWIETVRGVGYRMTAPDGT